MNSHRSCPILLSISTVLLAVTSNALNLWIGAGRDAEGVPSRMIRKVSE